MNVEKAQTLISNPAHHLQWKVSATSVCGSSHEKLGTPCQDASFWMTQENNILIAAVADGAGSASHSDVGAQIAVQTAVQTLCAEPDLENKYIPTHLNPFSHTHSKPH